MSEISNTIIFNEVRNSLRVFFGADRTYCQGQKNSIDLYLKIPTFDKKNSTEYLMSEQGKVCEKFGFEIIESNNRLIGALVQEVEFPLEPKSYQIYLNLLKLTQDWNLWRVWNYIPFNVGFHFVQSNLH